MVSLSTMRQVSIGLYGAASGTSEATILQIENTYAGMNSQYPAGTVFDKTYTHLPARMSLTLRWGTNCSKEWGAWHATSSCV